MSTSSPSDPFVVDPATEDKVLVTRLLDQLADARVVHVIKPWGAEDVLVLPCGALLKVIRVDAGQATSVQYHERKREVIAVIGAYDDGGVHRFEAGPGRGAAIVGEGEIVRVEPHVVHRSVGPAVLVELTTADNADVVRLVDKYGRQGT